MRSIRICFVSNTSIKYGAEFALLELLVALKQRGVECSVILPSEGQLCSDLKKHNITYFTMPFRWWAGPPLPVWRRIAISLWNFFIAIRMAITLSRWKCDVVISNTTLISVGAVSAKLLGLPHVWNIHELGVNHLKFEFYLGSKFSLMLINHLCKLGITCSRTVFQEFQKYIPTSKLRMVYQSVTVDQDSTKTFSLENNSKFKCVIVGRVDAGKQQEDAVRAISELTRQGVKLKLYIVGGPDPSYKKLLSNIILEHGLEKQVEFIGYVENAFPFVQFADILLNCSRIEAFGRVTVEAMKAGKPVIAARSYGNSELIREGFNGLLYTPADYKELVEK